MNNLFDYAHIDEIAPLPNKTGIWCDKDGDTLQIIKNNNHLYVTLNGEINGMLEDQEVKHWLQPYSPFLYIGTHEQVSEVFERILTLFIHMAEGTLNDLTTPIAQAAEDYLKEYDA